MRVKAPALVLTVLVAVASGCGDSGGDPEVGGTTAASPAETATSATPDQTLASPTPDEGAIDASFDVGAYELQLSCSGEASRNVPTIVYLHGLGGDGGDVHEALAPDLVERGRLCTYDRLNVGGSDRVAETHTGADSVEDLHTLLAAAKVRPPYVLLGFSFGGLIAAMYAGTHPSDVEGVLMLDSSLPTDAQVDALIPDEYRDQVMEEQQANNEGVDFYATLDEADALMESVPRIPVTYMAAYPVELPSAWPVKRMQKLIAAKQQEFVDRFPQGRLVRVRSSHDIDLEHPDLVIAELDRILGS